MLNGAPFGVKILHDHGQRTLSKLLEDVAIFANNIDLSSQGEG
jgi:hypothetical protein